MKKAFFLLLLLLMALPVSAQEAVVSEVDNEHVNISWPPPVTEVWGVGDVLGTADVEGMAYYYLEYKALNDDLTIPENAPWIPVTPAITQPVENGPLATLDTRIVPDGVYALRLTVNTEDNVSYHDVVTPVRVDNARFTAVIARIENEVLNRVEADDENDEDQIDAARPTPPPIVTPPPDNTPRVTPTGVSVNVRRCDLVDNDRCPPVTSLNSGTFGRVIGVNSARSWFHIVLPGGAQGWVSRTVVQDSGDFSGVPVQIPPAPLPPRPVQPLPPAITSGQPIPNGMSIDGGTVTCNQPFRVLINLGNGSNVASSPGQLTLQDVNLRTGTTTYTGYASYPSIAPGQNFVVSLSPVITSFTNERHELRASTRGHQFTIQYTLEQGNCGATAENLPGFSPVPSTQRTFAAGECNIILISQGEVYDRPEGSYLAPLGPGTYPALQVQRVGSGDWYQLALENNAPWVINVGYVSLQGNCGL